MIAPTEIVLPLCPIGKMRPRFQHGGRPYHSPKYATLLAEGRSLALEAWRGREPINYPVAVSITFCGPKRPAGDTDNLAGFILDCLQGEPNSGGIVLADDRVVWPLACHFEAADEWSVKVRIVPATAPDYPKAKRRKRQNA